MTILELEQLTKLERATIRYYERQGLLRPQRKENSYRDYSQEDAQELLRIKLMRQLELPIDAIKNLQQGTDRLDTVLQEQAKALLQKTEQMHIEVALCQEISANALSYRDLDPQPYLTKCEPNTMPVAQRRIYREYHPFRRLFAGLLDYFWVLVLVKVLLIVVLRIRPYGSALSNVVSYGSLLLSIPAQALMLHFWGTTPGKWLMGIQVVDYRGGKMSFANALEREWKALVYGYGLGIPFIRIWRMYRSYKLYRDNEDLRQDEYIEHIYATWDLDWNKGMIALFSTFCVLLALLNGFSAMDATKPKHLGNDLTIAEFAENYNFYSEITQRNVGTMCADGTWKLYSPKPNSVAVTISTAKVEKPNEPFQFETEGDRIRKITYENSWTDVQMLAPLDNRIIMACLTAAGSQRGLHLLDIVQIMNQMQEKIGQESVTIQYKNIEISWQIYSENCTPSLQGTYFGSQNEANGFVSLSFQILIQ